MKKTVFELLLLIGSAAVLRAEPASTLHASFPDGTTLEIFTQTTGSSQVSPQGWMELGQGSGSENLIDRLVVDRADNILFAYNLEASRPSPGMVKITIAPISAAKEANILKNSGRQGFPRYSGAHLPTVLGVSVFAVRMGQAVTLDILYKPSTGEKVYDVLRPIANSSGNMSVTSVPATELISLSRITIRVDGRALPAPNSVTIGAAVRVDIPHQGTYVIAAQDPGHDDSTHVFAQAAYADGRKLSWGTGKARVEITSEGKVLTQAEKGTLWLFHDPHYQPDVVALQSADKVDWLFPKR